MVDESLNLALYIITNYLKHSDDEVIGAIRYLARNGYANRLKKIIDVPKLYKSEFVFEVIKESRGLWSIDHLQFLFNWPSFFEEYQISEAIDVAMEYDRKDFLTKLMIPPGRISIKNREKISKYIFKPKKAVPTALNEPFSGLEYNKLPIVKVSEKNISVKN
ncbi:MAG: hypothetical protein ABSA11_12720 [Candidatus Bathyarchaeia archaeon]|jgi:hypothetical protein